MFMVINRNRIGMKKMRGFDDENLKIQLDTKHTKQLKVLYRAGTESLNDLILDGTNE